MKLAQSPSIQPRRPFSIGILAGLVLLIAAFVICVLQAAEASPYTETGESSIEVGRRLQLQQKRSTRLVRIVTGGGGESGGQLMQVLIRIIVYAVFSVCALVFACMYKSKVVDRIPLLGQRSATGANFKTGICGCVTQSQLCFHICCCGSCRLGHTVHVAGVCDYWPAVLLWYLFPCCNMCFGVYYRMALRQKLGLAPDTFCDILSYCFCAPCAVGQDAFEVDAESGAEVNCVLALNLRQPPASVGPVSMFGQPVVGEVLQK